GPAARGLQGLLCGDSLHPFQDEVCSLIHQRYVEFLPSMQSAADLESQVQELSGNIDQLKMRIENEVQHDLTVAIAEFAELKQQLERDTLILTVLKQLQEFDTALKYLNVLLPQKNYMSAARQLTKVTPYVLGTPFCTTSSLETGSLESATQTELHLSTALPKDGMVTGPTVASVLQAFAILGELRSKFQHFGQLLLKYILKPLISHPSLRPCLEERSDAVTLRFESVGSNLGHPSPVEVFAKLKLVLRVLHKYQLDVPLEHGVEEEEDDDDDTPRPVLAEVLGDVIWKEMSDCLIRDCLVHSIPNNSSKLGQYSEVIKAAEEFEEALKDMRFLKEDSTDLLTYARNVNGHFADKKCQDVIVAARSLMTSEIHNTIKVTPDSSVTLPPLPDPGAGDQSKALKAPDALLKQVANLENEARLSRHTLSFPACRISDSVQKLMTLAYQTLQEASASMDQYRLQLFYSVRNIFLLFCDVVPMYHKENLQKLPQLAAIHHNNCMYIAHHLLTLGHQFQGHLNDRTATFVDLVPGFRKLESEKDHEGQPHVSLSSGTECFVAQMRVQKEELLERLSSVLHQLKRLGKVWQDVLPVNVYCKAMGTLLNMALAEILNRITALEDISAENADRLHALCQIMVDEGPGVFVPLPGEEQNRPFQEEVPVYVPKWMTFRELMLVLQASLQEIVDRWADGKGPLAAEFSPGEVKNLIRALFQNTERRAAALARIK
ncbi:hypothetical protein JD844_031587, partial [Phrynosoma platyrhinos]